MRSVVFALSAALILSGCSVGSDEDGSPRPGAKAAPREEPTEAGAIRAWSDAVNAGDFERAASYFVAGAVVEQAREIRLPDRAAAEAFNRSLPCMADVTDVKDEGDTVLAAFRLRDGPGGPCDGAARVRFRFRDGKFSEWRQLAEPAQPNGPVVMLSH